MAETEQTEKSKNPVQAAERRFSVMETLAQTGPVGLVELSGMLGLHKSTVHRLLLSLTCMGYVQQDEETSKYMLTFKLVELSEKILAKVDILTVVHPYITRLANDCNETVHFVQRRGTEVFYLDKVAPCSGVGKSILAEMSEEEVRYIWNHSEIEKKTEHTIVTLDELLKELQIVKEKGYALDNEENELGVRCIAVCVPDHRGRPMNAFSISAPVGRMTDERINELAVQILRTKEEIQLRLGQA